MNGWFTVERIDTQTFAISEYQHYEETHCYLLCGQNKAALIDTGLGVSNIKCVVNHLTTLPVTVFTTHVHWDHIGGHKHFDRIAVHEAEINWIDGSFPLPLEAVKAQLTKLPCAFPEDFDVDVLLIYDDNATVAQLADTVKNITESGKSVKAQKVNSGSIRYRQLMKLENGEVEVLETND